LAAVSYSSSRVNPPHTEPVACRGLLTRQKSDPYPPALSSGRERQ
jgi:hypothetical protein